MSASSSKATEKTPLVPPRDDAFGFGATASLEQGLSSKVAQERLKEDGPNKLETAGKQSFLRVLYTQAKNVIFFLTLCASALSFILGDDTKAVCLVSLVVVVCLANAIGEYSGQDAAAALAKLAPSKARVMRDGREVELPAEEIVVGDVVLVSIGDVVPADIALYECEDLQCNESLLTGESKECKKRAEPSPVFGGDEAFPPNMLFKDTEVVAGRGRGEVVATGMRTQVGLIAKRLKPEPEALSPLQLSINQLGAVIGCFCGVLLVTATVISYMTRYQNPMTPCADDDDKCLLLGGALRGIIMAVSLIPHGLPFVVMVMLRVGGYEMQRLNAVVTKYSCVDYLGAANIICTDKTGTLTEGKMVAKSVIGFCRRGGKTGGASIEPGAGGGNKNMSVATFYPLKAAHPNGWLFAGEMDDDALKRQIDEQFDPTKRSQSLELLPSFGGQSAQVLSDPLAVPGRGPPSIDALLARAHLACSFLSCHSSTVYCKDKDAGIWCASGNMTEASMKVAAAKGGYWEDEGRGAEMRLRLHAREPDLEVSFTSGRKMMVTVHRLPANHCLETLQFREDVTHVAVLKGAPDRILPKLKQVLQADAGASFVMVPPLGGEAKITKEEQDALSDASRRVAASALRGIVVAICPLPGKEVEKLRATGDADERLQAILNSDSLCFLTLWGIYDPPRSTVKPSINECHNAGIRVVMITGDQYDTAVAIGQQVGIIGDEVKGCERCSTLHAMPNKLVRQLSIGESHRLEDDVAFGPLESLKNSDLMIVRKDVNVQEPTYKSGDHIKKLTNQVHVWSRAQPADKVTIVSALQVQGNVTAMTGDGVNDAPALKKAGVGVAMGITGTAVARNASDLILMDDNFSTIVAAVKEGRRIYLNTQKYITFNFSLKGGEVFCLMWGIVTGIPAPIEGLQLLANLVFTHILPTTSLAWEEAEDYVMTIPPREVQGDLVVSRTMMLFRFLPFLLMFPSLVMTCLAVSVFLHTGFVEVNHLIGTSRVGDLEAGRIACEFGGVLDEEFQHLEDQTPFHCRCYLHPDAKPWRKVVKVDQWGPGGDEAALSAKLEEVFNPWSGYAGGLFDKEATPWKNGPSSLLEPCKDAHQVERWCWKDKDAPRPLLPLGKSCAAYGTQLGQTMSYVTIQVGEILALISYRLTGPIWRGAFKNKVYNGLLLLNITVLFIFVYVPPVYRALGLAPLTPLRFGISLCFVALLIVGVELSKVLFRHQLEEENKVKRREARLLSLGGVERPPPRRHRLFSRGSTR